MDTLDSLGPVKNELPPIVANAMMLVLASAITIMKLKFEKCGVHDS